MFSIINRFGIRTIKSQSSLEGVCRAFNCGFCLERVLGLIESRGDALVDINWVVGNMVCPNDENELACKAEYFRVFSGIH